ncbi:MAG: hypothetical protein K9J76_07725 [Polaromonas sp.]|nr:hypothetical protein [Polaromonas sp.]
MKKPLTQKIIPIQPTPIGTVARRFFIFGLVLHAQDLTYLALLPVLAALTHFFTTVIVEEKSTFLIPC